MKTFLLNSAKKLLTSVLFGGTEDSNKRGRTIGIIVALIFALLIVPVSALSMPGILFKGVVDFITGGDDANPKVDLNTFNFDEESLSKSEMYTNTRDVYIKYLESLDYKFNKRVEEIKEEYTYERTVEIKVIEHSTSDKGVAEDKESYKTVTETVVPEVIKNISITKPELRYLLAFIGTKYVDLQTEKDNYVFNEEESLNFLNDITVFHEEIVGNVGDDPIYYNASTTILDLDSIAKKYFTEDEYGDKYKEKQEQFRFSFESMADLQDTLSSPVYDYIDLDTLNIHENGMEIPHMLQYDTQWGTSPYGSSTVAKSGCAVTCMAMIQAYLTGEVLSPAALAKWSNEQGYYISGQGTSWGFFGAYSKSIGIKCKDIGKNSQQIIKSLEEGRPVIASMSAGTFTKGGHFIVLRGITKSGKILVNDPNDNFYSKNFYKKEFDINLIYSEAKNFWSFDN